MRGNFEVVLELNLNKFKPEELRRKHIEIARAVLKGFQARQPEVLPYEIVVDGARAGSEDSVRSGGVIRYNFLRMATIGRYALLTARELSPVRTGHYKQSWIVIADRTQVDENTIPNDAQELIVVNFQPYSRKIHTRGARVLNIPPGIVERLRQNTRRRFKSLIKTDIRYISLQGGYTLKKPYIQTRKSGRRRIRDVAGSDLTYPALVITSNF